MKHDHLQALPPSAMLSKLLRAVDSSNTSGGCSRRHWLALLAASCCGAHAAPAWAVRPGQRQSHDAGVSTREARDDAVRHLPLTKLSMKDRNRVSAVVNDTAIFRRMPTQTIACDSRLYQFLINNPDLVVSIWRSLGISDVALERTGPNTFRTDDKQGTAGTLEILHSTPDTLLAFADGSYDGALFSRKVLGKTVLLLKAGYYQDNNQTPFVTCRLDAFIQIDNVGAELLVKSFQPLVGHFADHNFRETANFVATLHHAAEVNPGKVEQLAGKLNDVSPVTRQQFVQITNSVSARVSSRDESAFVEPPQLARKPTSNSPVRR